MIADTFSGWAPLLTLVFGLNHDNIFRWVRFCPLLDDLHLWVTLVQDK
jgi:hypothetical protein